MSGRPAAAGEPAGPRPSAALDVLDPVRRAQSADEPVLKLKKQANTSLVVPVSNNTPAPAPITPAAQVRVVAVVGSSPIYESEIRESMNQRLGEVISLQGADRADKERKIFAEELKRVVERELILEDMVSKLRAAKKAQVIEMIQEDATKDADKRLREFKKSRKITSDEEFGQMLEQQGLTLTGMRRQIERNFMMGQYISNLIGPKAQRINFADGQDDYKSHADEFKSEDRIKWQDVFLRYDKFPSPEAARAFAQQIVAKAKAGEDFASLAKKFDQGDSSLRGGFGSGEKPGEVQPQQAEEVLFRLQPGEVGPLIEMELGIHIVRIAERSYAGTKPFDVKTQNDVRKKLSAQTAERELKRVLEQLRRQFPVVYPNAGL